MNILRSELGVCQHDRKTMGSRLNSHPIWLGVIPVLLLASQALLALESEFTFIERLPANHNDVAIIKQEVESPALSRDLLYELELTEEKDTKAVTVKCTPQVDRSNSLEELAFNLEIGGLPYLDARFFSSMLRTYINSRTLGMTPRLSAERAFLRHRKGDKGVTAKLAPTSDPDLKAIRYHLALPTELLIKSDALEHVFGKKEHGEADYLLPDGDLMIFIRVHPGSIIGTTLPVDRRLLTHPFVHAEFEKMRPQIDTRKSKIEDDLRIPEQGRAIISAEQKIYWRAMSELFAERGWNLISVDSCTDYQMQIME